MDCLFESAKKRKKPLPKPDEPEISLTTEENIRRGIAAMNRVINTHRTEEKAMYRKKLGWISFVWGKAGIAPPEFPSKDAMLAWWNSLIDKKKEPFKNGYGISHIIAKRDWEGKYIKPLLGQNGKDLALSLVQVIAQGVISKEGNEATIVYNPTHLKVGLKKHMSALPDSEDYWLVTGMQIIQPSNYKLILESAGERDGSDDPTAGLRAFYTEIDSGSSFNETGGRIAPTHSKPTLPRQEAGAADSISDNIPQDNPLDNIKMWEPPKWGSAAYGFAMDLYPIPNDSGLMESACQPENRYPSEPKNFPWQPHEEPAWGTAARGFAMDL